MPDTQASQSSKHPLGSTLEQRYEVVSELRASSFGTIFLAQDLQEERAVHLLYLSANLCTKEEQVEALRESVQSAHAVDHKNVARVLSVGVDRGNPFVISDPIEGQPLCDVLRDKLAQGTRFTPRQVSKICANLSASLVACESTGGHGALFLESISITEHGKITLGNLGLGLLTPRIEDQLGHRLSPEVRAGKIPSGQADVYGIGAAVYELLVGAPPEKGCQRPSQAVEDISGLIDQFVGATTAPDPKKRPTVRQIGPAAMRALASTSEQMEQQSPPPAAQSSRPSPAPSLALSIPTPLPTPAPSDTPTPVPAGAYSAALAQALTDTHERWLIAKGKLDYGPFPLVSIVQQIDEDKILPGDVLVDNETGNRVKVEEHPLLTDVVDAAKEKRDHQRRANAEVAHTKQERKRGAIVYVFIAAAVAGIGAGGYAAFKALSNEEDSSSVKEFALSSGSLEPTISFPSPEQANKRRGRSKRAKRGDGTSGGWNDSLSFDMDDGSDVGSETLSNGQVNPVIQRSGGKLGACLRRTKTRDAFIEFMVKGTGKVYQVRVNGSTSSPVAKCLRKVMFSMKFPAFDGRRSKHNFELNL